MYSKFAERLSKMNRHNMHGCFLRGNGQSVLSRLISLYLIISVEIFLFHSQKKLTRKEFQILDFIFQSLTQTTTVVVVEGVVTTVEEVVTGEEEEATLHLGQGLRHPAIIKARTTNRLLKVDGEAVEIPITKDRIKVFNALILW